VRGRLGIDKTILDIIRKKRLKWFGHVNRWLHDSSFVKSAYKKDFAKDLVRKPPKRWTDLIRKDVNIPILTAERYTHDRDR